MISLVNVAEQLRVFCAARNSLSRSIPFSVHFFCIATLTTSISEDILSAKAILFPPLFLAWHMFNESVYLRETPWQ